MSLGYRVKELRKKHNLTQLQLAEVLNMGRSNIGHIENNRVQPSSKHLEQIADLFNTTSDYLLKGTVCEIIPITKQQKNQIYDKQVTTFKVTKLYKQLKIVENWFISNQDEVPEKLKQQLKQIETEKEQQHEILNNLVNQFQPSC
ncbi:helix-turn-helix domain-containing protein [Gottfriedia solisilvae]|uniref:helix-turn-helix domain-containing protein n=1 Tax=Gottfriedia solisilvae TaxID=1516104 RepID=UPI003D2F2056